jgi:nucleoside-diphosphate-sugar epimerase
MSLQMIIGAGPVGSATALRLAAGGHQVRIITRSGTGPDAGGIEKIADDDQRAWGRAWHVPAGAPMSQREIYTALARLAGAPGPRLRPVPRWLIRAGGPAVPYLREFTEMAYQFNAPFVVDSSAFTATFGAVPTPAEQALAATLTWWGRQARTAAPEE